MLNVLAGHVKLAQVGTGVVVDDGDGVVVAVALKNAVVLKTLQQSVALQARGQKISAVLRTISDGHSKSLQVGIGVLVTVVRRCSQHVVESQSPSQTAPTLGTLPEGHE